MVNDDEDKVLGGPRSGNRKDDITQPNQDLIFDYDDIDADLTELEPILKRLLNGESKASIVESEANKKPPVGREITRKKVNLCAVEVAARSLTLGFTPAQVRRSLAVQMGQTVRSIGPIIKLAQEKMVGSLDMSPKEMRVWIASLYLKLYRDPKQTGVTKAKALSGLSKLFGMEKLDIDVNISAGLSMHDIVQIVENNQRTIVIGDDQIDAKIDEHMKAIEAQPNEEEQE